MDFVDILWRSFDTALGWIQRLYEPFGINFVEFLLGVVILFSVLKFVISPFISGAGSSDKVLKSKKRG